MAQGYINLAEFGKKAYIRIILIGTNNNCKCLVGNKLIQFDYFQPDRSIYKEISLELGAHNATVTNIQKLHPLSLRKIQEYTEYPCMIVFVLQSCYDTLEGVELLTQLRHSCGEEMLQNTIVLLFSDKSKSSARPDPHVEHILYQCQKKLCHFNQNMESNDLMKQLLKCWKTVPEMQINHSERSYKSTFEENEAYPGISGQRHKGTRTNIELWRPGGYLPSRHPKTKTDFSSARTRSRSSPISKGRPLTNGGDRTAIKRKDTMTIVLLGQTGSGKSATGNTILRKPRFISCASSTPVTQECQMAEETVCGSKIRVIDTPDFFHESLRNHRQHIEMCKRLSKPGPDAYLLVMELGRFTDGERSIVKHLQRVFGDDVVSKIIILFTWKEKLGGKAMTEYIENTDPHLQQLIKICGSRYIAFNNNDGKDHQIKTLFDMISNPMGQQDWTDICERKPQKQKDCIII